MTSTKLTLDASKYDTDKAAHAHYLRNYEEHFRPLRDRDVRLLELGVLKGGSLLLWRDYFDWANIITGTVKGAGRALVDLVRGARRR